MALLRTIHDHGTRGRVVARLEALDADTPGRWGRMNAGQMVKHLDDLYRFALGEIEGPSVGNWFHHTLMRWWAVTVPLRWPHGFPTAARFDQERDGTPPAAFDADRRALIETIGRFTAPDAELGHHPIMGPLSHAEWGRWGFRHADHHLRQFGV